MITGSQCYASKKVRFSYWVEILVKGGLLQRLRIDKASKTKKIICGVFINQVQCAWVKRILQALNADKFRRMLIAMDPKFNFSLHLLRKRYDTNLMTLRIFCAWWILRAVKPWLTSGRVIKSDHCESVF